MSSLGTLLTIFDRASHCNFSLRLHGSGPAAWPVWTQHFWWARRLAGFVRHCHGLHVNMGRIHRCDPWFAVRKRSTFLVFFFRIYTNWVKGIPDFLQGNFANDSWLSYFLPRLQGSPSSPMSGPPNGRRWACLWVRGSRIPKWGFLAGKIISTLWLFNIAMENGP